MSALSNTEMLDGRPSVEKNHFLYVFSNISFQNKYPLWIQQITLKLQQIRVL